MEESFTNLPSSHLLGSVPAVVSEDQKTTNKEVPVANLQIFPPNNGGGGGGQGQGYQTVGGASDGGEQQQTNWKGFFIISSYTQYFNVDTDIVLNRLISSLYPITGDFVSKIDANPDLYGLVWISTTLVFVIASLGNCATYLMQRRRSQISSWAFDVNYLNVAAGSIYGYALIVPFAYYFLLQYMGLSASLVRFWCLWGYSLFIFVLSSLSIKDYLIDMKSNLTLTHCKSFICSCVQNVMCDIFFFGYFQFLLVIPVEFLRWTVILIAGAASSSFVALNLRSYIQSSQLTIVVISAFVLQMGLSVFIKMWFFA